MPFEEFPYTNFHELNLDWIINTMKQLQGNFKTIEEAFEALKEYVISYLDSDEFKQLVSDKLDEMLANGDLDDVIDRLVNNKNIPVSLLRTGRLLDDYNTNNPSLGGQSIFFNEADGMYYTSGSFNSDADQVLSVWNQLGTLVNAAYFTGYGHFNGITVIGDVIYVTSTNNKIATFDRSSLAFIEEITISTMTGVSALAKYDDNNLIAVGYANLYDNLGASMYNIPNGTSTLLFAKRTVNQVNQGACYYDGYLYRICNRSNQIYKLDINTGDIVAIYDVPNNDGYYYTGENEGLFIKDSEMYLYGVAYLYPLTYATALIGQMFKTDILGRIQKDSWYSYITNLYPSLINVDGNAAYDLNPVTTFTTMDEACFIVPNCRIIAKNLSHGSYYCRLGERLAIDGDSTVNLTAIYSTTANISLSGINKIDYVYLINSDLFSYKCNIDGLYAEYSSMDIRDGYIHGISSLKGSKLRTMAVSDMISVTPFTETGSYVEICNTYLSNANATTFMTNLKNLLTGFASATLINMSFGLGTTTTVFHSVSISCSKTELNNGISVTTNGDTLAISSSGVVTYNSAAINRLVNVKISFAR